MVGGDPAAPRRSPALVARDLSPASRRSPQRPVHRSPPDVDVVVGAEAHGPRRARKYMDCSSEMIPPLPSHCYNGCFLLGGDRTTARATTRVWRRAGHQLPVPGVSFVQRPQCTLGVIRIASTGLQCGRLGSAPLLWGGSVVVEQRRLPVVLPVGFVFRRPAVGRAVRDRELG